MHVARHVELISDACLSPDMVACFTKLDKLGADQLAQVFNARKNEHPDILAWDEAMRRFTDTSKLGQHSCQEKSDNKVDQSLTPHAVSILKVISQVISFHISLKLGHER